VSGAAAARRAGSAGARRTVAVLDALAQRSPSTLTELASGLGMAKSTTLAILDALVRAQYVARVGPRGPFALGPAVAHLGQRALGHEQVRARLLPAMEDLVAAFGHTCNLGVWAPDRQHVLYVEKVDGVEAIRIAAWVGKTNPCYCTAVGKALLMAEAASAQAAYLAREAPLAAFTPTTITSPERLGAHLAESLARGYAVDDEEHEPGVRCVAVTVCDILGKAVAALSIAAPADRLPPEAWQRVAARMAEAVRARGGAMYAAGPQAGAAAGTAHAPT
jgi:DNA-binding IclR family transcriptional regulator